MGRVRYRWFTFHVQGEKVGKNLLVVDSLRPSIGTQNGVVDPRMGLSEPGGVGVVEVGEGAFRRFWSRGPSEVRPRLSECVEFPRRRQWPPISTPFVFS